MQKKKSYSNNSKYTKKNEELTSMIKFSQENDEENIEDIIRINEGTIKGLIKRLEGYFKTDLSIDRNDLMQEGRMGVVDAVRTYDPNMFENMIVQPLTHISNKCYAKMLKYVRNVSAKRFSMSDVDDYDIANMTSSMFRDDEIDILDNMAREEIFKGIIDVLSPREKSVVNYKYFWHMYNRDTAATLGISEHTVTLRHRTAKKKIKKIMKDDKEWLNVGKKYTRC